MTDETWLTFVRSLIHEPVEKYWKDTELAQYRDDFGIPAVVGRYWYMLAPRKKKFAFLEVEADNPYVEMPADYYKFLKLEDTETGLELNYIEEDELYFYETMLEKDVRAVMLADDKLYLVNTPTAASTTRYRFWYMPKLTTLAMLPEILHPLVAFEAIKAAKFKDQELRGDVMAMQQTAEEAALTELSVQQIQQAEGFRTTAFLENWR